MMNLHTSVTDNNAYTMLYVRSLMFDLRMNKHTCITENTTYTILYVRALCQIY